MSKPVNKVIKILIASDLALNSAWGLLGPIFAIFIVQKIAAGNAVEGAKIAGFASLIYWIVKSSLQIPIGRYLDKNHGEKDDFWSMVLGTFLAGLAPFGYLIASQPLHIYGFQIIHAIGMAMVIPSWSAIFTRHIDKGKEAFEWGLDSTFLGFGAGIAGAIGGIFVAVFGFKVIFILVGIFTIISAGLLLLIHKEIAPRDHLFPRFPPFRTPF
ncbi:MFS transporter [Patescibacteria group bacterium]|nr:MFS transporter [Patescibacteria group bacterium]MBZ9572350.1 MFS transporter [Patescibacteria group bacterium]